MSNPDRALETQIKNIETRTGKSLSELREIINQSPLTKHSELREMMREQFDLGYGDANMLVHIARQSSDPGSSNASDQSLHEVVDVIYSGKKEDLRQIHDAVMEKINTLGEFEIAPKKKYLSLRRKKQFAMVGPGTRDRVEVGLNMKGVASTPRLESLPPGGMCQYRVYLSQLSEVDDLLLGWIKIAYDSAG